MSTNSPLHTHTRIHAPTPHPPGYSRLAVFHRRRTRTRKNFFSDRVRDECVSLVTYFSLRTIIPPTTVMVTNRVFFFFFSLRFFANRKRSLPSRRVYFFFQFFFPFLSLFQHIFSVSENARACSMVARGRVGPREEPTNREFTVSRESLRTPYKSAIF